MNTKTKETKYLLDIQSGEIIKEIPEDIKFYSYPEFECGVEVLYNKETGKLALINYKFEFITDYIFDHCNNFCEELAAVEIDNKWGYINLNGDFVIEPQFKRAYNFKSGLAKIQDTETGRYGFIDKLGRTIIGYYDFLGDFSEGLVYAQNKDKDAFGFINESGEIELALKYPVSGSSHQNAEELRNFTLQEFECCSDYLVEKIGFKMINGDFYDATSLSFTKFYDGLCQFLEYTDEGVKVGFYNKAGKIVVPAEFDFISRFCDGISLYSNGNNIFDCKSGVLKKSGEKIEIGEFLWETSINYGIKGNLIRIRANKRDGKPNANGKYGFANKNGKIAISPRFDRVYDFYDGVINVETGFLNGFINESGEYIIPATYDKVSPFCEHGLCVVSKYKDYYHLVDGIIDKNGVIVAPLDFEDINILSQDRFYAKTDNGYMLFDITGVPITNKEFGSIRFIYDNLAIVYIDTDGKKDIPTGKIFREKCGEGRYLYFFECYPNCADSHGHGFGIMKEDGTILTAEIFEHIGYYSEGFILGETGGSYFDYIDLEGNPVLFNFNDTCSEFIDGAAYIVTHNWAHGSLMYHNHNIKLIRNDKNYSNEPLINNRTTFFMNKNGDIINLDTDQQEEFLRKYFNFRKKRAAESEWPFKEYVKE